MLIFSILNVLRLIEPHIDKYVKIKRPLLVIIFNCFLSSFPGKDVNECASPSPNACVSQATCVDTFGNYMCTCNSRFNVGDGRKDGSGCKLSPWIHKLIIILPGKLQQSLHGCFMDIANFHPY